MSMSRVVAAALVVLPALAHAGVGDAPIVGGGAATAGAWPDVAAILGTRGYCSGTLIAPDLVLTAGHCAEIAATEVRLATTDYNNAAGVTAQVASVTAYPNWQSSYDVAIVRLTAPVAGVTPRTVAQGCTFSGWSDASDVHLVGFGSTDAQATGGNSKLYEVDVPVVDPACTGGDGCKASVAPNGEFVAGGDGKDSCNGDSGGPVFMATPRGNVLVGAVSRATSDANSPCGDGGIYVRADKVVAWIEQTTGETLAKDACGGDGDGGAGANGSGDDGAGEGREGDAGGGGCAVGGSGAGLLACVALVGLIKRRRD